MKKEQELEVVDNQRCFWDFIRRLRSDPRVQDGFRNNVQITEAEQEAYMEARADCYIIAVENGKPVGFAGVVDNDIRVCVDPAQQGRGVAKSLLREIISRHPGAEAVVKVENTASRRLFDGLGYQPRYVVYSRD